MASPASLDGVLRQYLDWINMVPGGAGRRAAHIAELAAAQDSKLLALLAEAAASDTPARVFARISSELAPPPIDRAAMAYGSRGMPSLEQRMVTDPNVRAGAEEVSPGFARRLDRGEVSPDEIVDVYGTGPLNPRRTAPLPDSPPRVPAPSRPSGLRDRVARVRGATNPVDAMIDRLGPEQSMVYNLPPNNSPAFQLTDLTFGQRAAMNPPRAADPDVMAGFRANFERQGDELSSAMESLAGDISAGRQVAGAPGYEPDINRMGMDEGSVLGWPDDMPRTAPEPRRVEAPDAAAERRAMEQLAESVSQRGRGGAPPRRPPAGQTPSPGGSRGNWKPALAAGVAGAGAGLWRLGSDLMTPVGGDDEEGASAPGTTSRPKPSSTADLAAETSPPPSVMTQEPAPISPRDQAQELIRKLNLMRREARGEVPEAPAMQREIDRLMAMSNQTMAAASRGEVATGGSDYHMQAARLMAQRNDMLRRGMPTQQAQQMMAEITRLQRLGDEQRNARQAPRRAG